jgi:hypothetical protein
VGEDLPGIAVEEQGTHVITLDPIDLNASEFRQLFYPNGNSFDFSGCEVALSDQLRNKITLNKLSYDNGQCKLNLRGSILTNAADDLDVAVECWEDCSVINLERQLSRLRTILDVGGNCPKVCALSYCEYLDVLKELGVAVVDMTTGVVSSTVDVGEQTIDLSIGAGLLQAGVFPNSEPFCFSGQNVAAASAAGQPLSKTDFKSETAENSEDQNAARLAVSSVLVNQQTTVSLVFKLPNPDAKDTVVKAIFNVNWATSAPSRKPSGGADTDSVGLRQVIYSDQTSAMVPYVPVPNQRIQKGSVDSSADIITVTVGSTVGFFVGDSVDIFGGASSGTTMLTMTDSNDGDYLAVSAVISETELQLTFSSGGNLSDSNTTSIPPGSQIRLAQSGAGAY